MTAPVTRVEYVVRDSYGLDSSPERERRHAEALRENFISDDLANAEGSQRPEKYVIVERTTTITERVLAPEEEG